MEGLLHPLVSRVHIKDLIALFSTRSDLYSNLISNLEFVYNVYGIRVESPSIENFMSEYKRCIPDIKYVSPGDFTLRAIVDNDWMVLVRSLALCDKNLLRLGEACFSCACVMEKETVALNLIETFCVEVMSGDPEMMRQICSDSLESNNKNIITAVHELIVSMNGMNHVDSQCMRLASRYAYAVAALTSDWETFDLITSLYGVKRKRMGRMADRMCMCRAVVSTYKDYAVQLMSSIGEVRADLTAVDDALRHVRTNRCGRILDVAKSVRSAAKWE